MEGLVFCVRCDGESCEVGTSLVASVVPDLTALEILLTKLCTEDLGWKELEELVLCGLVSEIKLIAVGRGLKGLKGLNGSPSVLVADVFRMLSET
jgi:hypothetical protein